ncbi:MAG: hypothetical protein ACK5RA_00450 [Cyanobacteriota bacterium]
MIRFSAFSLKLALGAAAALATISLSPGSAQAFVVTVGGVQYDVTTFTGTPNDNGSKFETAANGGVMPWWGSGSLASQLALALGAGLGLNQPGCGSVCTTQGPLFAYDLPGNYFAYYYDSNTPSTAQIISVPPTLTKQYAQATLIPSQVPGPLPLLGAAAAFGFSRKLRKRIKLAPGALDSALPQA